MKKTFCDVCNAPMTGANKMEDDEGFLLSITVPVTLVELTVNVGIDSASGADDFDICKYCVFDAIAKLDDRPKAGRDPVTPPDGMRDK